MNRRTTVAALLRPVAALTLGLCFCANLGRAADPVLVTNIPTTGPTSAVLVEGHRVFLANGSAGLEILDVQETGATSRVGSLGDGQVMATAGPALFFRRGTEVIWASDTKVYRADITDPAHPQLTAKCEWFSSLSAVTPLGNELLLGSSQLYVARFLTPTLLMRVSAALDAGPMVAAGVTARDGVVIAAAGKELTLYDVSIHTRPLLLSRQVLASSPITPGAVDGALACLALYDRTLLILDLADCTHPTVLATNAAAAMITAVRIAGNRVLVSEGTAGIEGFEFTPTMGLVREFGVDTPGNALDIAVSGPLILVAGGTAGLQVYRTDRLYPPRITEYPQPQLVHPGETCTFRVGADGRDLLTYQWLRNGIPITEDARHQGTQSPTLVLSDVTEGDAAGYSVVVSCLGEASTTPPAQLTVSRLHTWGRSRFRSLQLDRTPPDESAIVSIAAGAYHDLALYTNGTVFAWGKNADGQTNVPPSATNAIAIAAGSDHSVALLREGTVVAWGKNDHGQTNVPPEATNVVALAAGWAHSLALRADGSLVAWGNNDYGQCFVNFLATDIKSIAAGYYHSLALRADGRVVSWGLGDAAPEWATNAVAIAGGFAHSLALAADGSVMAWGDDTYGQSTVPAAATNVIAISAGFYHSLALRSDGTVVAWGKDVFGMVNHPATFRDIALLGAGEDHSLALMAADHPAVTATPAEMYAPSGGAATMSVQARAGQPSGFQWYRAGVPVSGATNRTLLLENITGAGVGDYSVRLRDPAGQVQSEPGTLALVDLPPGVGPLPGPQAVGTGTPVELGATVAGSPPFSYQWMHDGSPLPGATNRLLRLEQVTQLDAGSYALMVTNPWGSAQRGETALAVSAPTDPQEMELALDTTGLLWVTSPNSPWTLTATNTADQIDALRCGSLTGDEESWVQTEVQGPAAVYWQWNVSSAASTNSRVISLVVETDTVPASGQWKVATDLSRPTLPRWQPIMQTTVGSGTHTIRWTAYCRSGTASDVDRCFLDRVQIQPLPHVRAQASTNSTLITLLGLPGWTCALEHAAALGTTNAWEDVQIVVLSNGSAQVEIPRTAAPGESYYRLRVLP